MHGFIGEFFGTMILIVLGCGACASVNLKQSYGRGSNWWYISISWGLAVTMGVYVAGFLGSQGHLNPAVTIPYAIFGLFPWHSVLPYLSGQFLGAFVGSFKACRRLAFFVANCPNVSALASVNNSSDCQTLASP